MTSPSTGAKIALLADRGVVRVAGEDAEKLLQGIITSDMELLAKQPAIHAALLTPAGQDPVRILRGQERAAAFLLETATDKAAELAKRLTMYKLRAKVDIRDASAGLSRLRACGDGCCQLRRDDGRDRLFRSATAASWGCAHRCAGAAARLL